MMAPMAQAWTIAGAAVACTAALVLAGCSWRLDTPPEPFRTPTAETVLRDEVAAAESAVAAAAATSDDPYAPLESAAVPIRLEALGGVSPTSSPRPSNALAAALDAADEATTECMAAAGDDPLGGLCASIALSHTVIDAAGERNAWKALAYLPAPETLPGSDSAVSADTVAQLALGHDRLRALYEVVAARSAKAAREAALERSAAERARVTELLAIDGVADLTEPAYDIPNDPVTAVEGQQRALAESYAALMVRAAPQDRAWLLNSAAIAYRAALASGMLPEDIPALPGAVQPSPSPSAS